MKLVNKRGNDFLDICRINDLSIANGRVLGDLFGDFTCHQKRGSSVVDYLITPCKNLHNIIEFKVGEHHPLISDHCFISATIHLNTPLKETTTEDIKMQTMPDSYKWDNMSSQSFTEKLKTEPFKRKVHELLTKSDLKMEDIKELLMKTADSCPIKKTQNKRRNKQKDKPWFDNECYNIKNEIINIGKAIRTTPQDANNREKLYLLKKKLRNLIKKNKMNYKTMVVKDMCSDLSKGKQKEYWKQLQKLEEAEDKHAYMPNFTLVNHFQELLQGGNISTKANDLELQHKKPGKMDHPISHEELALGSKVLKRGKGTGIDLIRNEMLTPLVLTYPDLILRVSNDIVIGNI